MSKKTIINLIAAFTFSTLAFGSVAHAGEITTNYDAKFSQMKTEHLKELQRIGSDINNLEAQIYYQGLRYSSDGHSDSMKRQVEQLKDVAIHEIAQFHKEVQNEFGAEMANNIYTEEQIAKLKAASKEKVEKNYSSNLSAGEIMANLIQNVTGMDFSEEIEKAKFLSHDTSKTSEMDKAS